MVKINSEFYAIAHQALAEYGLDNSALTFIRHSDNVTFRIDTPGFNTFLLRIHVPITRAMGSHGADVQMINSELLWLEALNRDTDLVLQMPIRNLAGILTTKVPAVNTSGFLNCTLLQWVDGQPYHRDLETELTAYQIGEILGKLHNHASQWNLPSGFSRPNRDIKYFEEVLRAIHPALIDGRINQENYDEFALSISRLIEILRASDENRDTHGIMHSDMHKGNMLINDGKIRLIDFSFCAFGNFMFDLGICLSDMKQSLHRSFLYGYQNLRKLPDNYQTLVEAFFLGSMVGTFSFWVNNPRAQELLTTKFPEIARNCAAKFNRGEHFWF